jgi:PAS domain S-box-containing protein
MSGTSILYNSRNKIQAFFKRLVSKPLLFSICIFCIIGLLISVIIYQRYKGYIADQNQRAEQILDDTKNRLQLALNQSLLSTNLLAFITKDENLKQKFDSIAAGILKNNQYIDILELVPNGVITHAYPLKGNESVIGYNILKDTLRNKEAYKAINKKQLFFAGPFQLKQGGMGVVGRLPVFHKDKFWGFTAVVIKMNTLLKAVGIDSSGRNGFFVQLSKINPDTGVEEYFMPQKKLKEKFSTSVIVPDGEWKLTIIPVEGLYSIKQLATILILGIFLTLLATRIAYTTAKKPEELEKQVRLKSLELEKSNKRNKAILNAITDTLYVIDSNGKFIDFNNPYNNPTLFPADFFIGKYVTELLPPDISIKAMENIKNVIQDKSTLLHAYQMEINDAMHYYEATYSCSGLNEVLVIVRDVTNRIESENAIKKSEENLWQVLQSTLDLFYVIDTSFRVTLINDIARIRLKKLWGSQVTLGSNILDHIPEPEKDRVYKKMLETFEGKKIEYEIPVIEDHNQLWLLVNLLPIRDQSEKITGLAVITKDISDKKKTELELIKSNNRFELITKTTNDAIWEWNLETGELWANETHQQLYGLTLKDPFPDEQKWIDRIHPEDREQIVSLQRAILNSDKNVFICEYRFFTREKGYRDIYDRSYIVRDQNGKPLLRTGSMMDVSEQKRNQEEIFKAHARFDIVSKATSDIVWDWDIKHNIIWWNDNYYQIMGYNKQNDFVDIENWFNGIHPGDEKRVRQKISEVFAGKESIWRDEYRFSKQDGTYIDVLDRGFIIRDKTGKATRMIGSMVDLTERIRKEEELNESYRAIRKLTDHLQNIREEERTHIAREIHDELGQQLTVLKMDASWLNKKIGDSDPATKEKLKDLLSILDDTVKTVRRISSELRPSLLDDLGLFAAMEWQLHEFGKRSGIQTSINASNTDMNLSNEIKTALFRIFQESLTNVARHSDAKNIEVNLQQQENNFVMSIFDDGKGFNKNQIAKKRTLGILGMNERTRMVGGYYEITSVPGKGTKVSVSIPVNNSQ